MTNKEKQEFVFYSDKLNYKTIDGAKGKEYFVEGYISTGDLDLVNDIVTKSCMDSMIKQFDGRSIKLDFEHETFRGKTKLDAEANKTRIPLGKAVDKSRDDKGVKVKWKMNPTWKKFDEKGNVTMTFKDIWANVESEMLDAFSIAYVPTQTKNMDRQGKSIRLLDDVNLLNVALTGNPINPAATMSAVMAKSLEFMKSKETDDMDNVEIKDTELKYKYIKRTGGPGNYTYTYPDGSTSKNPNKKPGKTPGEVGQNKEIEAVRSELNPKNHEKFDELIANGSDPYEAVKKIINDKIGPNKKKPADSGSKFSQGSIVYSGDTEYRINKVDDNGTLHLVATDKNASTVTVKPGDASDVLTTKKPKKESGSELNYDAKRFLETIRISDRKIKLDEITVEKTPKGNWAVFRNDKNLMTVGKDQLKQSTVDKYNLARKDPEKVKKEGLASVTKLIDKKKGSKESIDKQDARDFQTIKEFMQEDADGAARGTFQNLDTAARDDFVEAYTEKHTNLDRIKDLEKRFKIKITRNYVKKKSVDELFNRAQELNLSVGMADRLLKSSLSDRDVDNKNMGYKQMVDENKPVVDAEAPETPVESGKEVNTPVEKPVEESKPEGKSMTLTELKSIVEVLVKDIDVLKKENADLKAIVEKPLQKAIGAEKKADHGAVESKSKGPIDLIR